MWEREKSRHRAGQLRNDTWRSSAAQTKVLTLKKSFEAYNHLSAALITLTLKQTAKHKRDFILTRCSVPFVTDNLSWFHWLTNYAPTKCCPLGRQLPRQHRSVWGSRFLLPDLKKRKWSISSLTCILTPLIIPNLGDRKAWGDVNQNKKTRSSVTNPECFLFCFTDPVRQRVTEQRIWTG